MFGSTLPLSRSTNRGKAHRLCLFRRARGRQIGMNLDALTLPRAPPLTSLDAHAGASSPLGARRFFSHLRAATSCPHCRRRAPPPHRLTSAASALKMPLPRRGPLSASGYCGVHTRPSVHSRWRPAPPATASCSVPTRPRTRRREHMTRRRGGSGAAAGYKLRRHRQPRASDDAWYSTAHHHRRGPASPLTRGEHIYSTCKKMSSCGFFKKKMMSWQQHK